MRRYIDYLTGYYRAGMGESLMQGMYCVEGDKLPAETDIIPQQWGDVMRLARIHNVLPLVYNAVFSHPTLTDSAKIRSEIRQLVMLQAIKTNDFIPVCDVNLYTYDFKNTANSTGTTINFADSKIVLNITHRGTYLEVHNLFTNDRKQIAPQGSLDKLLWNLEVVKHEVRAHNNYLKICINGLDKLNFIIRHRPFKIEKDSDNNLLRVNELNQQSRHTFKGDLFLFPLDGTRSDMAILKPSDNGIYPLPTQLPEKYLVCEDNYTSTSGRLEVRMHTAGSEDINRGEESRRIQQQIIQELRNDSFGTERWKEVMYWLDQTYKYSVPASKLHDLKLCGSEDRLLVMMAFHAYMFGGNTSEDKVIEKLSSDLDTNEYTFRWSVYSKESFIILSITSLCISSVLKLLAGLP